jgi:hypothetical protein
MNKLQLNHLAETLEIGLEATRELLAVHDVELGRSTMKNEGTAKRYEEDIQRFIDQILFIQKQILKKC